MNTKDLPYWLLALVILLAALYAQNAKAETALHLGGWSHHLLTEDATNETHDAFLVEHGNWLAGRFNNSYNRESYAIGYGWSRNWGHWRGAVHVGAVKGYRKCFGDDGSNGNICPLVVPSLAYTRWRIQPEVLLMGDAVVAAIRVRIF